jgi:acetyl esterase/lipase
VGNGGGWPNTLLDVAAAVDALADAGMAAARGCLDLARVAVVGHSAGGQLAVWLAARPRLRGGAPGSRPRVTIVGAVSQAGVLDLSHGAALGLGSGAVSAFVGGFPGDHPDRYADASPSALLPVGVPTTLVHGLADDVVPIEQSDRYAASAARHGDNVRQIRLPGIGHFELIDVHSPAWVRCRDAALAYVRNELSAS